MSADGKPVILVIRHGALGDIVLSSGPFKAIRVHHKDAHIIALTKPVFAPLLKSSGFFDEVWADERPKWWQLGKVMALAKKLNAAGIDRVYDLQTSQRSSFYYRYFTIKPEWSGIVPGCSHPHLTPERTKLHTVERQKQQLAIAGIDKIPPTDISWMKGDITALNMQKPFALIVAGGSAHRPEKRWPAEYYSKLCGFLHEKGVVPALIGTSAEEGWLLRVADNRSFVVNLCNRTDFGQIAELARHAKLAVGNDTGPMHIIAAAGCPSLALFSAASNPDLCAPRGAHVRILRAERLADLLPEHVETAVSQLLAA